jgi:hypothetical protein
MIVFNFTVSCVKIKLKRKKDKIREKEGKITVLFFVSPTSFKEMPRRRPEWGAGNSRKNVGHVW